MRYNRGIHSGSTEPLFRLFLGTARVDSMSINNDLLSSHFRHIRWTGTLGVVAGFTGAAGTLAIGFGYFGSSSLRAAWLSLLPWAVVIAFGFLTRFLKGNNSRGASFGLAVSAAAIAGPAFLAAAAGLRWLDSPDQWPTPLFVVSILSSTAESWLVGIGLVSVLIAALGLVVVMWIPTKRAASIAAGLLAKSAYRIEIATLIFILTVVALATASQNWSSAGTYSNLTSTALTLSWLIPLTLILALTLRSAGSGSLWVAAGLGIVFVLEPAIRSLGLGIWSGLGWTSTGDTWYQSQALSNASALIPTLSVAWTIVPIAAIIAVIILWNSQPPIREYPARGRITATAPLDPWAGTAFVLAFVPLLFIPAIILGHLSYERIIGAERPVRGRLLAGAAIVFGIINIFSLVLFFGGALPTLSALWSWI